MRGVALNFFPLASDEFSITLYRIPFKPGDRPVINGEVAVRRTLPIGDSYESYWTLFEPATEYEKMICAPSDNVYVTIDALRIALIQSCETNLDPKDFKVVGGIRKRVEIRLHEFTEGIQVISLDPYLLRSHQLFGYLANFHFRPHDEYRGTRRAQELSHSLDKNGHRNLNYYADRYDRLLEFVDQFHRQIFPIHVPGNHRVEIESTLVEVKSVTLDIKKYVVGSAKESRSQFLGVKEAGPFERGPEEAQLCFLYRPQDKPLSHDLFRALRGDTFSTFPGMERMFGMSVSNKNVSGAPLNDFSAKEIQEIRDRIISDAAGRSVIPVVITPFSRNDEPEENRAYWQLKHAFLSKDIPIQVVAADTVRDKNKLKWSTSGIGLQIFAKAGGIPWKVHPRIERCLIVGVGQAHRKSEEGIERYFAYSVLADSSGLFEEVRVLGEGNDEAHYLDEFASNLHRIFDDYRTRFNSFVIHATFSIQQIELERIARVLRKEKEKQGEQSQFASLKFNDRNRFFGFAPDHNSLVPYESSVVRLSHNEYLVWFEGLQYGQPTIRAMIGGPLHVQFNSPREGLTSEQHQGYLQDAVNLSGANWRGFNAKSLPVSVYYAQLIAKYIKEFESHGLPAVNVRTIKPWFL